MDRRQQKTRRAIFDAFARLLERKPYAKITVQNIIDEANIGRSTFYAHFETKDSLLDEMCADIFHHVFSEHLHTEETHDFSGTDYDFQSQITHILYHLKDHRSEITRLFAGESADLFLTSLKAYLPPLFETLIASSKTDIRAAYLQNYLAGSFADTVQWWVACGMEPDPEIMASEYVTLIEHGIEGAK